MLSKDWVKRILVVALVNVTTWAEAGLFKSERRDRQKIIVKAQSLKGSAYRSGSAGPSCFDCSGFVHYILKHELGPARYNSSRTSSAEMTKYLESRKARIACSRARPADIIFFPAQKGVRGCNHIGFVLDGAGEKYISALDSKNDIKESKFGKSGGPRHRYPICYQNVWVD